MRLPFGFAALLAAASALTLSAQPPATRFDFARTLWRVSDGLPEETVQALAEASDGRLWIGTSGGLAEFDGSHIRPFERHSAPAAARSAPEPPAVNSIFSMSFAPDGTLWAGTEGGGLLRLQHGDAKVFAAAEGLSDGFVRSVAVDSQGRVWAGTDDGLFLLEGNAFHRVDGTAAIAPLAVHSILHDREGRTWAGGSRLLALSPTETAREFPLPGVYSENRVKKILEASDRAIWVGTVGGLDRLRPGAARFESVPGIHATVRSLLESSDGTLWIGTIGDGLWTFSSGHLARVSNPGVLPSQTVLSIFEDRNRQLWIGTQAGLVRLDRTPVNIVALPEGGDPDFETISGDGADVWVSARHLYRIQNGVARLSTLPGLAGLNIRNVFRSRNGDLWIGTDGTGAYRLRKGALTHFTAPGELTNNFIRGFLESRSGDLWIATDEGVSRLGSGPPEKFTESNGLAFFSTRSLFEDRTGSIWIGTDHGLSRWQQGSFRHDAATDGLASEKIWSILEDRTGTLWFGTRDHGLFRFRNGRLTQWTMAQGLPSNSIYQLLQDPTGTFWISGPNTIASIPEASMQADRPTPDQPLSVRVYALPFAAEGAQMYGGRQPAGFVAADGSVWFASTRGAAHIVAAPADTGPPARATLDSIEEDGRSVPVSNGLRVPANVTRLSFAFTALSLESQAGVRFRYKLENFDQAWTTLPPAGSGRLATYTNLPAGRFRFRVLAFDAARPAEVSEASLDFTKQPFFYQTWWFFALCALALAALAFALYRLRVGRIRTRFEAVLSERNRMAREMHDTVIQGCTGISALLEAMATTPASTPHTGELLDFARTQARTTIAEARQAVWNMRNEESEVDLVESLSAIALQTTREFAVQVDFHPTVERLVVGSSAAHEILMTVREAVYNAVQHSGAKHVTLELRLEAPHIVITVADRGCGFAVSAGNAEPEGHFGLLGMRERIERLGGHFTLDSTPGSGTRILLNVPRTARSRGGHTP